MSGIHNNKLVTGVINKKKVNGDRRKKKNKKVKIRIRIQKIIQHNKLTLIIIINHPNWEIGEKIQINKSQVGEAIKKKKKRKKEKIKKKKNNNGEIKKTTFRLNLIS